MLSFMDTAAFPLRPWLLLHAGSDLLIFASYALIPLTVLRFVRARPDLHLERVGYLFAALILLCGLTHLAGVVTLWTPIVELQGLLKLATALVSVTTAVVLFPLIPKLVALPSQADLTTVNQQLQAEVAEHHATLAELQRVSARLEVTVDERTHDLIEANERLTVVSLETVHRAKNLLTVVQSIARQSATYINTKDELIDTLAGRMSSLGRALTAVIEAGSGAATLSEIIETQLEHYCNSYGGRIEISGPHVQIRAEAAQQLGLAIHELATNAVKYGALSGPEGRVRIFWQTVMEGEREMLALSWSENTLIKRADDTGQAIATATAAAPRGFGSILLERAVPMQLRGTAKSEMTPTGLRYHLSVPTVELAPHDAASTIDDVRGFPLRA